MKKSKFIPRYDYKARYNSIYKDYMNEFNAAMKKAGEERVAFAEFRMKISLEYSNDQKILPKIDQVINEIEKRVALDKSVSFEQALEEFKGVRPVGIEFVILIASYMAKRKFIDFLHVHPLNQTENEEIIPTRAAIEFLTWGSGFKQRDFLKIIYALKEVGYLKGEVNRMVPFIAQALNYPLSKDWHTNFSKGLHKNNHEFNHGKVFETLKMAFETYAAAQISNQMKRTNKKN